MEANFPTKFFGLKLRNDSSGGRVTRMGPGSQKDTNHFSLATYKFVWPRVAPTAHAKVFGITVRRVTLLPRWKPRFVISRRRQPTLVAMDFLPSYFQTLEYTG